jgi:predicted RNase H-like nuclease (RuvC/YqgF family)
VSSSGLENMMSSLSSSSTTAHGNCSSSIGVGGNAAMATPSAYHHLNQHHTSAEYLDEFMEKYAQALSSTTNAGDSSSSTLNQKLEEIRNYLRNEVYKQYKLQEGAEKMRSATSDKKRLQNLNAMIKESNLKIEELNQELADLNSFIVVTQSESSVVLDPFGHDSSSSFLNGSSISASGDINNLTAALSTPTPAAVINNGSGNNKHSDSSNGDGRSQTDSKPTPVQSRVKAMYEQRIRALEKQLEIETKIKAGAENMLATFSSNAQAGTGSGSKSRDKRLCEDAQAMLKDARLKIEYLKMQLNKV